MGGAPRRNPSFGAVSFPFQDEAQVGSREPLLTVPPPQTLGLEGNEPNSSFPGAEKPNPAGFAAPGRLKSTLFRFC